MKSRRRDPIPRTGGGRHPSLHEPGRRAEEVHDRRLDQLLLARRERIERGLRTAQPCGDVVEEDLESVAELTELTKDQRLDAADLLEPPLERP